MMNPDKFRVLMKFLEKVVECDEFLQCKYCLEPFENTDLLKKHSITQHREKRLICDFCLKEFASLKGITYHLRFHMNFPKEIKQVAKKRPCRKKSFEDYEPESVSESDDSDYDQYDDMGKKNRKPDIEYPRQCDHCDYIVPMRKVHYHHYLIMHVDIIDQYPYRAKNCVPCTYCGVLKNLNQIKDHEMKHTGVKVKCTHCDKQFASRNRMTRHVYIVHKNTKLICDFCSKDFKTRVEITRHIRTHTGEKPFKCHICGAGFAHSGNRQIHIRSAHQNIKQLSAKAKHNSEKKGKDKKKKPLTPKVTKEKGNKKKKNKMCLKRNKKVKTVYSDPESDDEALSVLQKKKRDKKKKKK